MIDRKFYPAVPTHCYQRTVGHGVLFYDVCDHLLFFTVFSVYAQRRKIRILKLVQMPDHVHYTALALSQKALSDFARDYASVFAKEYNAAHTLSGPVFETPFGSAPKRGDKAIRTNLIYLDNNPVERKLVKKAEEYRWNYLAYATSSHPFSDSILLRFASMPLRRAIERIKYLHASGRYPSYTVLKRLLYSLPDSRERQQLTDFIIGLYSVIDHAASMDYFGGYENELTATHSTTGSEYDLCESFIGQSDTCYKLFTSIILQTGRFQNIHQILRLSHDEKRKLGAMLRQKTYAPYRQIAAFLHLPVYAKY